MSNELALLVVLGGVLAGAFVAPRIGARPWQGGVVVLAGAVLSVAVLGYLEIEGAIWPLVLSMLGAGMAGGILKMTGNQIVGVYLVAALGQVAAYFVGTQFLPLA